MVKQLKDIVEEKNLWEAKNFPDSGLDEAILGVIEEVGELAHAHLKDRQKIRGTEEEHATAARDAVGDATVYLIGVARHSGVNFETAVNNHSEPACVNSTAALFRVSNRVGRLAADRVNFPQLTTRHIGEIYWALAEYCRHRDWDIHFILHETWEQVGKRDWTKNRETGQV